jgi:peptide deformylase
MEIITDPKNKILASKTNDIEHITSDIKLLANEMFEIMIRNKGVGLSANQVGHPISLIVFSDIDHKKRYVLINPKVISVSKASCEMEEACLSVPNLWGNVIRPEKITLEAKNLNGKKIKYKFDDILARIVQHELDHLSGILFTEKAKTTYKQSKYKENEI